ncbi:MAG TPA: hypothetical protein VIK54_00385 [Acidimicrobiia bacterium]
MEGPDLASNLEFWSGRARNDGAGESPKRRRPSMLRGSRPGGRTPRRRSRPVAAALLLGGLTTAWLVAGHRSHAPAAVASSGVAAPSSEPLSTVLASTVPATTVLRIRDCNGLSSARREVRCVIDGVDLDVQMFDSGSVAGAYRRAAGAAVVTPRSGPPACARGVPDERAWSTAAAPDAAVGRYRCRFEDGRAAMWWTRGDRLVHAVASDGDLAGLFSWWRAHPSE